jgi:integrase
LNPAELGRLAEALAAIEDERPMEAAAIRLLAFTGARRGEVLDLTHDEVDLENRVLRLRDSKTGRKPVKLNAPAIEILAGLPRLAGCDLVVWGSGGRRLGGLQKTWDVVRKAAGLEKDVRLHDLRHSFASVLVSGGASLPLIGALLGHSNPATTARYAHLYDDPVHEAAERAGEAIAAAMRRKAAR